MTYVLNMIHICPNKNFKKKKKKNYGTRVPCEFFQITRFSRNRVSKYGYFAR